ncbi:hypothetical protein MKW94_020373 [Papaver nudicaule]|uniref:Uncharacterized protein n=1 Tax=Papaver nudicaule TaxID=74823 RepID=A0AA42AXX5_PAPNU|nr:hypothetical protein [Papaver nudicaule]
MEGGGSVKLPLQKKNNNLNFKSVCTQVQTKWGEFYEGFNGWVSKQPFLIETTVAAATYALQGVASGFMFGTLAQNEAARNFYPFQRFGKTRALQVRNFAILRGTDGALISAMRRIRGGKDDTSARMVAGFYSGYVFQMLIRNSFDPGAPDAIAVGLFIAFCHGLMHEVLILNHISSEKDTCYTRARRIDLAEAGIPPGPRVLILNHIKRCGDRDLLKMKGS